MLDSDPTTAFEAATTMAVALENDLPVRRRQDLDEERRMVDRALLHGAKQRSVLDSDELAMIRTGDEIEVWRLCSFPGMVPYLMHRLGYSAHTASERLRVARELARLPKIHAALDDGELTFSHVRALSRVATPATEDAFVERAKQLTAAQTEELVRGLAPGDRPTDPKRPDLELRDIILRVRPATYALYRQRRRQLDDKTGERVTDDLLAESLLLGALEGGLLPPAVRSITTCPGCRRHRVNGAGIDCDLSETDFELHACDSIDLGNLDGDEAPRVGKEFTVKQREAILERDRHCCTVPGCRSRRHLQIHHIEEKAKGGGNRISNGTALCSAHHRATHAGKLTIRGTAPDKLAFEWCTGDNPRGAATHPARDTSIATWHEPPGRARARPAPMPRKTPFEAPKRNAPDNSVPDDNDKARSPLPPAAAIGSSPVEGPKRDSADSSVSDDNDPAVATLSSPAEVRKRHAPDNWVPDDKRPAVAIGSSRAEAPKRNAADNSVPDDKRPAVATGSLRAQAPKRNAADNSVPDDKRPAVATGSFRAEAPKRNAADNSVPDDNDPTVAIGSSPAEAPKRNAADNSIPDDNDPAVGNDSTAVSAPRARSSDDDPVSMAASSTSAAVRAAGRINAPTIRTQVRDALVQTGWRSSIAAAAADAAIGALGADASLERILFEACRRCSTVAARS